MTRINLIKPKHLLDQHLMAEYREMPMVHAALRRSLTAKSWCPSTIPRTFLFATGHVKFFYNKGDFLADRWDRIVAELLARGYNVNPNARTVDWSVFDQLDQVEYVPTDIDRELSIQRILVRVSQNPNWYRYKGTVMPYKHYAKRIRSIYGETLIPHKRLSTRK